MLLLKNTLRLLGLVPLGIIISLFSFYYRSAAYLGYYPSYNHPDPKEIPFYDAYDRWINVSFDAWVCSFLLWLFLLLVSLLFFRKENIWRTFFWSALPHMLVVLLLFSGLFEWYVD